MPHPVYSPSPKAKRVEFRCPDGACNPYLAFAAMLMAGLDESRTASIPANRWTRTSTTSRRERARVPSTPAPWKRPSSARGRPQVPLQRRRLHDRRHRDLSRLQALARGRRNPHAASPLRVRSTRLTCSRDRRSGTRKSANSVGGCRASARQPPCPDLCEMPAVVRAAEAYISCVATQPGSMVALRRPQCEGDGRCTSQERARSSTCSCSSPGEFNFIPLTAS